VGDLVLDRVAVREGVPAAAREEVPEQVRVGVVEGVPAAVREEASEEVPEEAAAVAGEVAEEVVGAWVE
jgi:hypothetical protein